MTTRTQVEDTKTLKQLSKAGKIHWPVLINWPKNKTHYPRYVNDIKEVGDLFEHNSVKYELRYQSGCFMPFLYKITE